MTQSWHYNGVDNYWQRRGRTNIGETPAVIVTYSQPAGSANSTMAMRVNGATNWIYPARFGDLATISSDVAGPIPIEVDFPATITSVTINPASAGVTATGVGTQTASFTITQNGHYSIEINGTSTPLFLAVQPLEVSPPAPGDVTYYYGPGVHDIGNEIILTSNQTCYIAGGALIKGKVRIGPNTRTGTTANNCTVSGRGIVDAAVLPNTGVQATSWGRTARVQKATNSTIRGISFVGMDHWNFAIYESSNITLDWIRSLNSKRDDGAGTPDGMDIVGSNSVTVTNAFIRAYDDGVAVKCEKNSWMGSTSNITVQDSVIWQGGGGNGLEIGWENNTGFTMSAIKFINIDIIRKVARTDFQNKRAALGIHLVGPSPLDDVLFEDIRVQHSEENNVYLSCFHETSSPSYDFPTRAPISNVVLRRVSLPNNGLPIRMISEDPSIPMTTVTWDDCDIAGTPIVNSSGMTVTNVTGLTFV